jgi:hypothetical protein
MRNRQIVTNRLSRSHGHPRCSEAQCSPGYSPFLTFQVDDMDSAIPRLLGLGAVLDGAVIYNAYGKTAAVRTPDGHMLGLYELAGLPDDGDTALAAAAAAAARMGTPSNRGA